MAPLDIALAGVIATAAADIWQQALKSRAGLPAANWRLIGRWVGWMPRGVFVHRPISAASRIAGEHAIGWAFHYAIGVAYAGIYAVAAPDEPTLASALAFGAATVAAPWLVMQPALGAGAFARNLPNRRAVRIVTATTHLAFGFGLYAGLRATGA
jgi:hypothetical protein